MEGSEHSNSLSHYGVKGMKWGVRRTVSQLKAASKSRRDAQSDDHKNAVESRKKGVKKLSNEELKSLNRRMQLERQYSDLKDAKAKKQIEKGKKYADIAKEAYNSPLGQMAKNAAMSKVFSSPNPLPKQDY